MPDPHTVTTIVRLHDTAGHEGVGATASYTERAPDLSVLETLGPLILAVLGRRPSLMESFAREFERLPLPTAPGARSALDIALWDLAARQCGLPLYELLGGASDRLLAYASSPFLGDVDSYLAWVSQCRDAGFRAVKLHGWGDPQRDVELLRAVHASHGDAAMGLMLDAEQRYERRSAVGVALAMQEMGCEWLEAPINDHDLGGYRELRQRVVVPILCSGNWLWRPSEVLAGIGGEAWDALRFDVTVAGGITAGRKLMGLAEAAGLPVELQSWGHTVIQVANLHLALAFGRSRYFEASVPHARYEAAVANPIQLDPDGFVKALPGPGLGVEIDWEQIAALSVASREWKVASDNADATPLVLTAEEL
jgi:L-alanine-DL-glutamate epimerase-like enolase superfamily enzyme